MLMEKIEIRVEKTNTGFSAHATKYPAFTTGKNRNEVIANMVEALQLYFEEQLNAIEKLSPGHLVLIEE